MPLAIEGQKHLSVQKYFVSSDKHLCRPMGLGQHSGTNSVCKFPLIILRFADKFLVTSIVSREGPKFYRIFYRSVEEQGEQNDSVNSYFPLFLAAMKNLLRFIAILYQVIHWEGPKRKAFSHSKNAFTTRCPWLWQITNQKWSSSVAPWLKMPTPLTTFCYKCARDGG